MFNAYTGLNSMTSTCLSILDGKNILYEQNFDRTFTLVLNLTESCYNEFCVYMCKDLLFFLV